MNLKYAESEDAFPFEESDEDGGGRCDCGQELESRRIKLGYIFCWACAEEKAKAMETRPSSRRARLIELSKGYLRTLQPQTIELTADNANDRCKVASGERAVIGAYWIGTELHAWLEGEELPPDAVKPVKYSELRDNPADW